MLTFYYHSSNSFTDGIKEKLEEMVVAHKAIQVDGGDSSLPDTLNIDDLPMLSDEHEVLSSPEKIMQYIEELHREVKTGRGLQSDTCHLDPDNPEKCL